MLQMPLRLSTAFCKLLKSAALVAATPDPEASAPAAKIEHAVWEIMDDLVYLALFPTTLSFPEAHPVAIAFIQQLHESGVFQQLPRFLTGIADRMDAFFGYQPIIKQQQQQGDDTGKAAASASTQQHSAGLGDTSSSSSSSSMADQIALLQEARGALTLVARLQVALPLLSLTCREAAQSPYSVLLAECATPLVHLAFSAYSSTCKLLSDTAQPSEELLDLTSSLWTAGDHIARDAAMGVVQLHVVSSDPDYELRMQRKREVWDSAHFLSWMTVSLVYWTYVSLLRQSQQCSGGNTTSSSSSSSSTVNAPPRTRLSHKQAWELACSQQALLPASHDTLLQGLGCSSKTVLWAAALRDESLFQLPAAAAQVAGSAGRQTAAPVASPAEVINDLAHMYSLWLSAGMLDPSNLPDCPVYVQLQRANSRLVFLYEHQISVLLPTVLLYWAAHTQEVPGRSLQVDIQEVLRQASMAGVLTTITLECDSETLTGCSHHRRQSNSKLQQIMLLRSCCPWLQLCGTGSYTTSGQPVDRINSSSSSLLSRRPAVLGPGRVLLPLASNSTSSSSSTDSTLHHTGLTAASLSNLLQSISRFGGTRHSKILRALRSSSSSSAQRDGADGSSSSSSSPAYRSTVDWDPHSTIICQISEAWVRADARHPARLKHAAVEEHLTCLFCHPSGGDPLESLQAVVKAGPGSTAQQPWPACCAAC